MESEDTTGIALEREKLQIERERLALERERLENERESYKQTVSLNNRAAGRMNIPVSTMVLSLVIMLLIGGIAGSWLATRMNPGETALRPSLIRMIDGEEDLDFTNENGVAVSPLIRALNKRGRQSGYLLILD